MLAAPAAGPRSATVAVAFSGGRDSLALLHATVRCAAALGLQVVALHVHHGLQPEADGWLRGARRLVAQWRRRGWPLALRWEKLQGQPAPGDSIEAWARAGRNAALARMARDAGASLLLLAHHRRDQAETVLLQALRGGGPAGLAAMPRSIERDGLVWARPWLEMPRQAIDSYVLRHRLHPVDDPSNADPRLARNRLRLQVWPALEAAFDGAEAALANAARRAHQADAALAELATIDLAPLVVAGGDLQVEGWLRLSPARQANALRAWCHGAGLAGVPDSLVRRVLEELPRSGRRAARWPADAGRWLMLYRGHLSIVRREPVVEPPEALTLDLSRAGSIRVDGWSGCFEVSAGIGPSETDLRAAVLRPRRGGERFQRGPNGTPRSLKKQFQDLAVPAPLRAAPLVWSGQRLLYVPGLGVDARAVAAPGMPQRSLLWQPDANGQPR